MSNRLKIYVLQENEEEIRKIAEPLEAAGYDIVGSSRNGDKAIDEVLTLEPDVLITGLICGGADGLEVIRKTNRLKMKIIVLSTVEAEEIGQMATKNGATYCMSKPINLSSMFLLLEEFGREKSSIEELREIRSFTPKNLKRSDIEAYSFDLMLEENITRIFLTIGIPPHIKGYAYLREGVKIAVKEPSVLNRVTKDLYPRIAKKFDTTPTKVERAMRHAIENGWNKGRIKLINLTFGTRSYVSSEKPTNSEFIALVADKLSLDIKRMMLGIEKPIDVSDELPEEETALFTPSTPAPSHKA